MLWLSQFLAFQMGYLDEYPTDPVRYSETATWLAEVGRYDWAVLVDWEGKE